MFPYLKPFLKEAVLAALCSIPLAALKAYQAYFVKDVFDHGFSPTATQDDAIRLAMILAGLGILNYPLRYLHYFGLRMVVDKSTCLIRSDIYKKLQQLPNSYFAKEKQGNLLSVLMSDTLVFSEAFRNSLDIIREPITAILLLGVACYHDWQLTLIILFIAPFFVVIIQTCSKIIEKNTGKAQAETAEMTHTASEGLVGQKIIKAFNLQDYSLSRFNISQQNFLTFRRKSNSAEEHSHPLLETIGAFAFAGVIVFAHHRISTGQLTTGGFVSYIAALAMFMDPVRKFSKANAKLSYAKAAGDRIFRVLDLDSEADTGKREFKEFKNKIEFKDVTFSYGEGNVIENFSMVVNKGERVALVGLSGSGKSTIVNLLLRLYPIEKGEILIDGYDIKDYSLNSIREAFALVSQDLFLFNDTLNENIKAGAEYSDKQLDHALEVAHVKEFLPNLSDGLETVIGDRGMRLSGGQAQRVTLARAFLRDSEIYLFDEATSALDNESEKQVQVAMEEVGKNKTVLAIAHRLTTIQNYDRIIVMKSGKKIEEGSHSELLSSQSEYKKLYELSIG